MEEGGWEGLWVGRLVVEVVGLVGMWVVGGGGWGRVGR